MSQLPRVPEPEVMDSADEAADYDAMGHGGVNEIFCEDLIRAWNKSGHAAPDHERLQVVDVGTGTCQIPIRLAQRWDVLHQTLAVDLSAEMLVVGMRNVQAANMTQQVAPTFCDARCLPAAGDSVDIVMSNSIVHHIEDPLPILKEMLRILRPGGLLFLRDLFRPDTNTDVEHLVATYAGEETAEQQQLLRQSFHAAFTVSEMQQLLDAAGLPPDEVTATSDRHWTISAVVH